MALDVSTPSSPDMPTSDMAIPEVPSTQLPAADHAPYEPAAEPDPTATNPADEKDGDVSRLAKTLRKKLRLWKIVGAAALLLAVIAILLYACTPQQISVSGINGLQPGVAKIVSMDQLRDMAAERGPIYWAGERADTDYEVTVTPEGSTFIRYLPHGADVGTAQEYLTVGTYVSVDGYDALASANADDADVAVARSGAVIVTFHEAPKSTFFSFPKAGFQVEVFAPEPGQAQQMTELGLVTVVPSRVAQ